LGIAAQFAVIVQAAATPGDVAAVSRAVRTPSVYEESIQMLAPLAPGVPIPATLVGNPKLNSESLLAYELGYRVQPKHHISLDVTGFYNRYRHLVSYIPVMIPTAGPLPQVFLQMSNGMRGQTYGTELSATCAPSKFLSLQGSYSLFRGEWGCRTRRPQCHQHVRAWANATPSIPNPVRFHPAEWLRV
jgi:outer membrane receptor for ferrienterochelin and colicin